jgi:hypothetical protein
MAAVRRLGVHRSGHGTPQDSHDDLSWSLPLHSLLSLPLCTLKRRNAPPPPPWAHRAHEPSSSCLCPISTAQSSATTSFTSPSPLWNHPSNGEAALLGTPPRWPHRSSSAWALAVVPPLWCIPPTLVQLRSCSWSHCGVAVVTESYHGRSWPAHRAAVTAIVDGVPFWPTLGTPKYINWCGILLGAWGWPRLRQLAYQRWVSPAFPPPLSLSDCRVGSLRQRRQRQQAGSHWAGRTDEWAAQAKCVTWAEPCAGPS